MENINLGLIMETELHKANQIMVIKKAFLKIYHYKGILAGKAIFKKEMFTREIYQNTQGGFTNIKD